MRLSQMHKEIDQAKQTMDKIVTARLTTGPIPPAAEVEHYEKILPGAFDRLLIMAEKSQ